MSRSAVPGRIKVDLHTHTRYSSDSMLPPAELVTRARAAGLARVAVTDHNSLDGAVEAHAVDPSLVIIGEEIDCADGEDLVGLFLQERIPPGLPIEEVAARIRQQGGVVYAPHPFAYFRHSRARAARVIAVADVVEVINGRAIVSAWNRLAEEAALAAGKPRAASSDGHFAHEIGGCFTELPYFEDAAGLKAALAEARPVAVRTTGPVTLTFSVALHLASRLLGRDS